MAKNGLERNTMRLERYHSLPSYFYKKFMTVIKPIAVDPKKLDEQNKKIDALLQLRQNGMFNYSKATKELIRMGVKFGHKSTGQITLPDSFKKYLRKFEHSTLEFEWTADYNDGSILRQFDDQNKEHDFADIDQSKLKSIAFISNFIWPTDNQEKRIIVRLNWKTGLFEFMNGFASQDVKAKCCMNPLEGEKKLILFARKRQSSAVGESKSELKEFVNMMDEFSFYNRFVLGYQVPSGEKITIIIEPNGDIKLFNN